jgi:cytochrome c5
VSALAIALVACTRADEGSAAKPDPSVHVLTLPEPPFELAEAPGRGLVVGTCTTCHSTRYIAQQPRFSRSVWAAEVDKMKKTYGAPLPNETTGIVDYLVTAYGRED